MPVAAAGLAALGLAPKKLASVGCGFGLLAGIFAVGEKNGSAAGDPTCCIRRAQNGERGPCPAPRYLLRRAEEEIVTRYDVTEDFSPSYCKH